MRRLNKNDLMNHQRFALLSPLIAILFLYAVAFAQEDPILERAKAGFRQNRMGDLVIKVVDSKGQPVSGAEVRVEMLRHQFLFGCNIFMWGRLGNMRDEETYRDRFANLFNYATLPFYWKSYESERGKPQHEYREKVARWRRDRGIVFKGHPLVWNHPASSPGWLPENVDEVRRLSAERVTDCVSHFKGLIDIWDVVNEATDPFRFGEESGKKNMMTEALRGAGVVPMVQESFAAARSANPAAYLLINDYRTDFSYRELINKLHQLGKPIYDAIGIQSHMHGGVWSSEKIWKICDDFTEFGVPLHFTEATIVSGKRLGPGEDWGPSDPQLEEIQAREALRFYTILFGHPSIEAITWWDFTDRSAWQGAASGLLRKDLSPKPIYTALRKLIREDWWTKAHLQTDETGTARVRAFYGEYDVISKKGATSALKKIFHDRKWKETNAELKLELTN